MSDKNAAPKKTGEDLMRQLAGDYSANVAGLRHERKEIKRLEAAVKVSKDDVTRSREVIKQELFDQCKQVGEKIMLIVYIDRGVHVLLDFYRAKTIAASTLSVEIYNDIKTGYAMYTVEPGP